MGSTAFNTLNCNIVQILGVDGATPVATDNPLPVSGSLTATMSGTIIVANATASLLNATVTGTVGLAAGTATIGKINFNAGSAALTPAAVNIASAGTSTLVAASGTTTVRAFRLLLAISTATNLTFLNGTTALTGPMPVGANGSIVLDYSGEPWFSTSASSTLSILSSVTSQLSGAIYYTQV